MHLVLLKKPERKFLFGSNPKLDEAASHVFTMRKIWIAMPQFYTINLDTWNSLPGDIQEQLEEAGKSASLRFSELYDNEWDNIIEEQQELGYTVTHASEEDIEKWMAMPVIDQMKEDWIKEAEEEDIGNARQIVEKISAIFNEAIENED